MSSRRGQQYRLLPAFILLVLAEGEFHGGAIHSALAERLPLFQADTGAVYRALQQMEQEGTLTSFWDTSGSGPARKIYRITPGGRDELDHWKREIELRLANLKYFLETYNRLKEY